jgi:hypothetical protein
MVTLRFAIPAILTAASVAGCFSYFVAPKTPAETNVLSPPPAPYLPVPNTHASKHFDQPPNAAELAAAAFEKAAEEILRRAPNTRASAGSDELPITGPIPLPKRRPIAR